MGWITIVILQTLSVGWWVDCENIVQDWIVAQTESRWLAEQVGAHNALIGLIMITNITLNALYTNYSWVIRCEMMNYFAHMWYHLFFQWYPDLMVQKPPKRHTALTASGHTLPYLLGRWWSWWEPKFVGKCHRFLDSYIPLKLGIWLVAACISGNGKLPSFRETGFLAIIGLSGVMHCHPKLKIFHFKVCFGWQYNDPLWFVPFAKVLLKNKHGHTIGLTGWPWFFWWAWWKSGECGVLKHVNSPHGPKYPLGIHLGYSHLKAKLFS